MASEFITVTPDNIHCEHICCAFSDKKCTPGYENKKKWLAEQSTNGYVFRRLDARAKVFIEYGPAETAWVPVVAPGFLIINCFWVSGQYKGKGFGKELLASALADAEKQGKNGLIVITGKKKLPFTADPKWFSRQGFIVADSLPYGYQLMVYKIRPELPDPVFADRTRTGSCDNKNGLVVYYSDRCPFTDYYVNSVLRETVEKRGLTLTVIKLDTAEAAQNASSPATIFSLFHNGQFVTGDLSVCLDGKFDKFIKV